MRIIQCYSLEKLLYIKKNRQNQRSRGLWQEEGREEERGKTWFALAVLIRICGVMLCKGNTAGSLIIMTRTNSPC